MNGNKYHQFNTHKQNDICRENTMWTNNPFHKKFEVGPNYNFDNWRSMGFSSKYKTKRFYNRKPFTNYKNVNYQKNIEFETRRHQGKASSLLEELNNAKRVQRESNPDDKNISLNKDVPVHSLSTNEATFQTNIRIPDNLNSSVSVSKHVPVKPMLKPVASNYRKPYNSLSKTNHTSHDQTQKIPVPSLSSNEATFQTNLKMPEKIVDLNSSASVSKRVPVKPLLKQPVASNCVINYRKLCNPLSKTNHTSHDQSQKLSKGPKINVPATKRILSSSDLCHNTISFSNAKLKEWSKGLQKACPNMSSCDTEIINHLVKLPCSHKDKVALKVILKEHSKLKKKLSYPRFNLSPSDSRNTLSENYESMEKAVSDAINVLPDSALNSLVCALDSDKEDHCDKTTSNNQCEDLSSSSRNQYCKVSSANKKRCTIYSDAVTTKQTKKNCTSIKKGNEASGKKSKDSINDNRSCKDSPSVIHSKGIQNSTHVIDKPSVETNHSEFHLKQEVAYDESAPEFAHGELNVANLMDLFANGSVKLKSEFDDPVIDAMRTFNSSVWEQVSSPAGQVQSEISSSANCSSIPNSGTILKPDTRQGTTISMSKERNCTQASKQDVDDDSSSRSDSSVFQTNVTILMEIANEEETLHKQLQNTEQEICHLNELLNTWKMKKNELQKKEIALRTKRQLILQQLKGAVADDHEKKSHSKVKSSNPSEPHNKSVPTNDDEHQNDSSGSALFGSKAKEVIIIPSASVVDVPVIDIEDSAEEDCEITKSISNTGQSNFRLASQKRRENKSDVCVNVEQFQAHDTAVSCMQIYEDSMYTSSNTSVRRFSLKNPAETIEFKGHYKRVSGLCIVKNEKIVCLYTSCIDGCLRSFNAQSGTLLWTLDMKSCILCMCKGWGKTFLGLQNGSVRCLKAGTLQNSFECSKSSISRLATASQGALRILCVISLDGFVTIWDIASCLVLRCLEGRVRLPSYTQIFDNSIYMSSSDKSLLIQDISSGKLKKMLSWPESSTGLSVYANYIISSSYDGVIRCYDMKKEFSLHSMYYGAGKECVTCMKTYKDWIFTGNRKGLIGAVRFKTSGLVPCEFGHCHFKFGSKSDLLHHVTLDHVKNMDNRRDCCPWRKCSFEFFASSTIKVIEA